MCMLKTFSLCVLFSLIINNVHCEYDSDGNVFNKAYVAWSSRADRGFRHELFMKDVTAKNLRDVVPGDINTRGRFSVRVMRGEIPLLKKESVTDIKNLGDIAFSGCSISDIEPGALKNLPQLTHVLLDNNKLTEIKSGTFTNLSITYLDLSHNNISTLQPGAFQHLPKLSSLNLAGNRLRTFSNSVFSEVSNVTRLNLRLNDISQIEREAFRNLPHLVDLNLKFNKLTELNCSAFSFEKLEILNLVNNELVSIPSECFKNLPQLQELDLSANKLKKISAGLFNYSKIEYLNLAMNQISVIASEAFDIPTLRLLSIKFNQLKIWDSRWLRFTPKLVRLMVWKNQIEELPDDALNYGSYINFAENGMKTISRNAFRNLKDIDHLNLEGNKIENWDVNLLNNIRVHYVNLGNNQLQCIDGDLDKVFGGAHHVILSKNPWRADCQTKIDAFNVTHQTNNAYSFFV